MKEKARNKIISFRQRTPPSVKVQRVTQGKGRSRKRMGEGVGGEGWGRDSGRNQFKKKTEKKSAKKNNQFQPKRTPPN